MVLLSTKDHSIRGYNSSYILGLGWNCKYQYILLPNPRSLSSVLNQFYSTGLSMIVDSKLYGTILNDDGTMLLKSSYDLISALANESVERLNRRSKPYGKPL